MGAAVAATRAPVMVPPVNETARTSGCSTSLAPASPPKPCTRLNTPAGMPGTEWMISASTPAVRGVSSEGLATTQLPMHSAGATFQLSR